MFKRILVGTVIEEGQRLIDELRRHRFSIREAGWRYVPESSEWRLTIVAPSVDRRGYLAAYDRVQKGLERVGAEELSITDISVISPEGWDYDNYRSAVGYQGRGGALGKVPQVVYEDAYIYRL